MPNEERPQDFELIELLIKEARSVKGDGHVNPSTQPSSEFKSFKARFQSYVDQVPSYLHSVGKEGFFPQFFLGSFSTFIDTEVAKELRIKKIYFRFDGPKTLKVAVVRDAGNDKEYKDKGYGAYEENVSLFMISDSDSINKKFTYGDLENILNQSGLTSQGEHIRNVKNKLQVRSVKVGKSNEGMFIEVEDNKLYEDISTSREFLEVKKGLWNNPEGDIEKLTNPNAEEVKKPVENILKKVGKIHSEYENSLTYAQGTREAAHHGFLAGALVNFRYRYNLRVYLEQFAGRGYADIVLVPRGKDRSLNAVPIIIELKAGTSSGTTPNNALEQAKDYAKGFQPNTMRVLTISDNLLCVGLNLDSTESEKFLMHISPREDRKIAPPTMQALLKEASDWNGRQDTIPDVKDKIKQPLERIYHTFPGTPEKGGNYFSRFLLGQLLLANEFERIHLEKYVFLYNEYPLAASTRSGPQSTERPVTTFMLTKGNQGQDKEVFIFHIKEGGKGEFSEKKIPINLPKVGKITEVCISLQEERKSDFFDVEKVNRYNSLNEYKGGKESFNGEWKNIPYPAEFKETFDKVLESQLVSSQDRSQSIGKYEELFKKIGEAMLPFKNLVEKEAHTQAVFHGAFSHYSDIKLGELQENRALVLTEFQTGRGKRIDMLIHGIKFVGHDSNAKEYDPVGLELKGPRKDTTADALRDEANKQITDEYKRGVTYKTLTDGKKVAFMGVVFDKGANSADSLILMSKDEFASVEVVHSSVFSIGQQQCSKGRRTRSIGISCIDSLDEEKITKEEKEKLIKELFGIEAHDTKIITIDSPQVRIDGGKVNVKFKDNNGNDKELIIDNAANIKSIENYILDKKNLEIKLKVSSDKEYAIIEEIKGQGSEYYLKIDDYRIKLDSIFQDGKEVIFDKLHQLSNDKQLLENKKYIEDIGDVQANQDYNNIVEEIKQNLLAKGVREDTFDRFKNHFDDLGEKVFADYIGNVESSLKEKRIKFDSGKFESAKIQGGKGGKFFSTMAIYDLLDSIGDTATLGRHDNNALKQVFGINGILDAMDDVRTSVGISPNSKVGKLISKVPQPVRQTFVKIISNPIVQSITFATIAYQFGYSVSEIAQGNHHPLNYYWTTSSSVKLASMSISPISTGVSFTVKSVSATTKILRGLSAAGKVLGRASVVTMVADVLVTMGVKIYERIEYTRAIAEQVPLLPGGEQAEVFFAGVIKFFTGRDVEKEYEDTIRIKGYLNQIKEVAIRLLDDNYNVAAVVQYVVSIEEKYSKIIKSLGTRPICKRAIFPSCRGMVKEECGLEKRYDNISFGEINLTSNVKRDLSSLNVSETLSVIPYTLVMSEAWEKFVCDVSGIVQDNSQCYQDIGRKEVYIVNTDAKHIPHLTKYEYENLGLRIVDAPLRNPMREFQCNKTNEVSRGYGSTYGLHFPCNTGKIHEKCQETFTLSGEPFIFTNPKRKDPGNTKKQTFPRGSILYISGPKTLTAAANYPAAMYVPEGSGVHYTGSKNNETIFVINNSTSGTLEGGIGKENTIEMNIIADNIIADLHNGVLSYGNSNNIRLVNTYNYASNSDNRQNITTNCKTTLINVKNAEIWQNSFNCTDKDYEVRVVNKENVHHRGLKRTIFVVNEDSDNAKIVSDLGSTEKIKENIDIIRVEVDDITQWGISKDISKIGYNLDFLSNDTQSIISSIRIDNFKNLIVQVNCSGIVESVTVQDKSFTDTIEDIRYQKLRNSGDDISMEVAQNSEKKLKAFIQASILDQKLLDAYRLAKNIASKSNVDVPIYQVEVIKNHMGIPSEKVIIAGMYSDQVVVDFSYNNSDVTSSYQKYRNNGGSYSYDDYMVLCNYYQDITVEGEKTHHRYVIKLPDTLNSEILSSPIRLNLKIKNKALPMPYSIIDFAELNVIDVNSIVMKEGERSYINECYGKSISDLTEDSLEIQDITIFDSKGTKWSLSIGLVDYFKNPENQQIVLRINNELYKIDSANLKFEHIKMDPNSFRYYQPEEEGLQIYHNQPIDKSDVGLVDFRDKSILDFDTKITDDSLVLSHKNNTLAKVENWNTYQPAREMKFAFNDTVVSNLKCIVSTCNSGDIIESFSKEKVTLLKERMFDAIVRNNINEAKGLIRKIETIEGKRGLTPLYISIQAGRLDIVKTLFDRKDFSVENKDTYPLHLAAQEGKLSIAKFFVDRGIDTGAQDNDGRTPLRIAAYNGNLDVVKFFLERNMGIEVKNNDPYKMIEIIKVLKKEIINQVETTPNVKRWAEFFVEKLRYSIKNVAQEKLKDGMLHDRYSSVNNLADEIYNSDGKLFDDIIKKVINDVYGKVDTKKILSFIRGHGYIGQLISGYVAVFDTMQRNNDLNNGEVLKLAYYIKETMNFDNYANTRSEKRSDLEKLKSRLPESVKNIVFASQVCITNVRFNEYIYSVDSLSDQNRRIVRTWVPSSRSDPPGSCGNDEQGMWKIQPYGDYVCITNVRFNEYLYSVDSLSDQDRRIVHTWVPSSRSNPPGSCGNDNQGMWRIKDCGSNVRKVRSQGVTTSTRDNNGEAFTDGSFNQSITEPPVCDVSVNSHFGENIDINSVDENGLTRIHSAAWKGQVDDARSLIKKGAYIDAEDVFGRKSIHVAVENNNKNIIEFFLGEGVSIDDVDRYGRTPLYYASWNGNFDLVKYLVEKGADINAQDKGGKTSLDAAIDKKHDNVEKYLKQVQLDKELLIAAEHGNLDEVMVLVGQGASLNAKYYSDGRTLMHVAAYGGNLDIVKYFMTGKENSLEIKDIESVNLKDSVYEKSNQSVMAVDQREKLKSLINEKDKFGYTPLQYAAKNGHWGVVNLFLDKTAVRDQDDVEYKDIFSRNWTTIQYAVYNGDLNLLSEVFPFLSGKETIINTKDNSGVNGSSGVAPLHYAVYYNGLDMVKFLVNEGADISAKDSDDKTPLDIAKDKKHDDIIKYLEQAHLDKELLLTVKNEEDLKTINSLIAKGIHGREDRHGAYYYAWNGDLNAVRSLVEREGGINITDKYGCTLLHWAALKGHLEVATYLINEKKANVNAKDVLGRTPMHFAVMNNQKDIQDVYGSGPMYTAAESNDKEIIELFLMKGASINEADKNGETPLHLASWGGHFVILQDLINNGANIGTKDSSGKTPLDIARDKGHNNLVQHLQQTQSSLNMELLTAVQSGDLNKVKDFIGRGASIHAGDKDGKIPLDIARDKGYNNIVNYLEEELNKEREKPVQRRRRHHHGDHNSHHLSRKPLATDLSNQPEIATSSGAKPSSWINGLLGCLKSSVDGLVSSVTNKFAVKESEDSKSGDTDACSAGLEKMYNATIPQSRKSLGAPKGNITNRNWSSNREKVRSNVTVVPEINNAVVDSALILGDLAVRLVNGRRHKQPIYENLLSPREQSMRSIDEDMIIRAIQQGKEKFGVPGTNMDEVRIIGDKTEIGK